VDDNGWSDPIRISHGTSGPSRAGGSVAAISVNEQTAWVKAALDEWAAQAGITQGKIFRAAGRTRKVWGKGVSQKVWYVVKTCCERAGLEHIAVCSRPSKKR
jgi:hypothetical protein